MAKSQITFAGFILAFSFSLMSCGGNTKSDNTTAVSEEVQQERVSSQQEEVNTVS